MHEAQTMICWQGMKKNSPPETSPITLDKPVRHYQSPFQTFVLKVKQNSCPGFGWDRVHFLPSSWYSAVF